MTECFPISICTGSDRLCKARPEPQTLVLLLQAIALFLHQ